MTLTTDVRPQRVHARLVLGLACAAQSVVSLDIAIVNVALPSVQQDLDVGHGSAQWVVVAYGLLLGGFLLVGGRLADLLGQRRVLLAGLGLFTGASLTAGAAPDAAVLIAARGAQGLGGALIAPAALSLLAVTFDRGRDRNRALGIFGAVGGASGSVGVVAGGLLASGPGWRWAFLINVPVGVMLIGLAATCLAAGRPRGRSARLDVAGASTVTGALVMFVLALHHATAHGWTTAPTVRWFVAAAVLMTAFVWIERRSPAPLLPAAAVRNRTLVVANLTALSGFGAFFAFIFVGSLLMQQILGYSPVRTGIAWLATTTTVLVASSVAGRLAAVGIRRLLLTGLSFVAAGALWLTQTSAASGYTRHLMPAFLIAGLGFGLCVPSLQIAALSGVADGDSGMASGLIETMREIGAAAAVAGASSFLVAGAGVDGFHTAFTFVGVLAVIGIGVVAVGSAGSTRLPHPG